MSTLPAQPGWKLTFLPGSAGAWALAEDGGDQLRARGWADCGDRIRKGADLAAYVLGRLQRGDAPKDLLQGLNGNFALVWSVGGWPGLAVDQVRSLPLVYRVRPGEVLASDRPWDLMEPDAPLDPDSVAEFATAGFVTQDRTIYRDLKALQAGELVLFGPEGPQAERYYRFHCTYDLAGDPADLCAEHDRVVQSVMQRAVESLNGRQIALPLSGGLDSRLIAASLKRMGYDQVFCFAYGVPGNADAVGSRRYAEELGLPWKMVPYEPETIRAHLDSPAARQFWRMCTAGTSMPFMNDYPAMAALRESGDLEPDAVFMPGQSGDFLVGTHLKYVFDPSFYADKRDVPGAVIAKHYLMWEDLLRDRRIDRAVRGRIAQVVDEFTGGIPAETDAELAGAYEYWEWQERQCKHVINEARCFEFFGHDWRMPLWDVELMEFWRRASLEHKVGAYLYREYLATVNPGGVFAHERLAGPEYPALLDKPASRGKGSGGPLGRLLRYRERYRKHKKAFRYGPTGFAQAYGKGRYLFREPGKRHDGSLLLKDFLREVYGVRLERVGRLLDPSS